MKRILLTAYLDPRPPERRKFGGGSITLVGWDSGRTTSHRQLCARIALHCNCMPCELAVPLTRIMPYRACSVPARHLPIYRPCSFVRLERVYFCTGSRPIAKACTTTLLLQWCLDRHIERDVAPVKDLVSCLNGNIKKPDAQGRDHSESGLLNGP